MKFKQSPLYLCTLLIAFAFLLQSCQEEEIISPVGEELQNKNDKIKINKNKVKIPDINFELALIDAGIDTGEPDGFVLRSNVENITVLSIADKSISDLSGIGYFSSLVELYCGGNQLTSLDVRNNLALEKLVFDNTLISNIDLSTNLALKHLSYSNWTSSGLLSNIDLSKNLALEVLWCDGNQVTNLDVSKNLALKELWCKNNLITNLDVSNHTALLSFHSENNPLTCIQVNESQLTYDYLIYPYWWTKDGTATYSTTCPLLP